jgi:ubiquinone biosynthesis protein
MSLELDFILEANNILKSRENLKDMPEVYVPEVFLQLCTHEILVVEFLDGLKMDNSTSLDERGLDRKQLAETTARAFLKTALEDGFFHGDLHMGNLFALPASEASEGKPRVGMIDFGIMGYLTPRARESLIRIFVSLSEQDFETLCLEFAELGASRGQTDFDAFQRNIQASVAPFLGLPLGSLNVGKVLIEATTIAARHHIRIPREWMLIFKAIYTLEGTCRRLDPTFNPMPLLQTHLEPLLKPDYNWNKFSKEMLLGSRDVQYVAQMLPRQLHWFFKRFAANGYALEVKDSGAEQNRAQSEKNNRALVLTLHFGFSLGAGLYALHLSFLHRSALFQILGALLLVRSAWIAFRQLS